MTKYDQKRITQELLANLTKSMMNLAEAFPENWDGIEIREYLSYFVKRNYVVEMPRRRRLDFENDVAIDSRL